VELSQLLADSFRETDEKLLSWLQSKLFFPCVMLPYISVPEQAITPGSMLVAMTYELIRVSKPSLSLYCHCRQCARGREERWGNRHNCPGQAGQDRGCQCWRLSGSPLQKVLRCPGVGLWSCQQRSGLCSPFYMHIKSYAAVHARQKLWLRP
jgi:hypothetical protein